MRRAGIVPVMRDSETSPGRAAHRLYAHVVWPTLGRIPLMSREVRDIAERHLIVLCRRLDVEPVCVRAFADRLHLLFRFKPGHSLAAVVSRLKQGSETALRSSGHTVRWGRGYAAGTVGGDEVRRAMRRIHRLDEGPGGGGERRQRPGRLSREKPFARSLDGGVDASRPAR